MVAVTHLVHLGGQRVVRCVLDWQVGLQVDNLVLSYVVVALEVHTPDYVVLRVVAFLEIDLEHVDLLVLGDVPVYHHDDVLYEVLADYLYDVCVLCTPYLQYLSLRLQFQVDARQLESFCLQGLNGLLVYLGVLYEGSTVDHKNLILDDFQPDQVH